MKVYGLTTLLAFGLLTAVQLHAAEVKDWPGLGNAPFLKEQWPATRVLVWAKPGISESALIPANWIEYKSAADYAALKGGRPATTGPDANTDIALPDAPAGQPYTAGYMTNERDPKPTWPATLSCRHVTIGSGAALDGGIGFNRGQLNHSNWPRQDRSIAISGNVTVRDGGYIYGCLFFVGDRHTCFSVNKSPEPFARNILVRKSPAASVTFMTRQYDLTDGVNVESGRLVLAPGASLRINATSQARIDLKKVKGPDFWQCEPYVWIRDKGTLELQAGSLLGRVKMPVEIAPDMRIEGLLQIGRAGDKSGAPAVIELTMADGNGKYLEQLGGLYIHPTAEVRNFGSLSITAKDPNTAKAGKGVSIFLGKPVDLGTVSIDCLRVGGIAATDVAAAKKSLAAASFGKHCATTGDALYSKIEVMNFKGGMGTVEFVDGLKVECEILFPLDKRLIVRSKGNRIAQSFDLKSVCAVVIGGKRTEHNPKRALTAEEQELRKVNALWADVPGKGQIGNYAKQDWPKAPLMVWRRPGESGSRFVASNWLDETGRPYLELPVNTDDENPDTPVADILLPSADTCYQVAGSRGYWRCRHMTIENNVFFYVSYDMCGNLWMKDGSRMQAPWFGKYRNETPGLHRFLRFDGMRIDAPDKPGKAPRRATDLSISQWGQYLTAPGATIELIGINMITDQFSVGGKGTVIISENSHLAPGNRTAFAIMPEATVVLLQDARIGCETIAASKGNASVWVGGTLMIGTPERPITRDMIFGVAGIEEKFISREPTENIRCPGVSFLVGKKGRLLMYTVDPTKARLVFKMHDSDKARENGKPYGNPKGILLNFLGKAELNGVVFDNILEGGIMVSPAQKATWKNVSYGTHNQAELSKLYWDFGTSKK